MNVIDSDSEYFSKYCCEATSSNFEGVLYSTLNIEYSKLYSSTSRCIDLSQLVIDNDCVIIALIMLLEIQPEGKKY